MGDETLRALFASLRGEAPGPWHVGQVFVNLDRGLSPAGTLHFKNLRLLGRASNAPWPNPGVTTVPELSGRILRALERKFQKRLSPREVLSPLAAIRFLSEGGAGLGARDPLHALESYREALRLAPLGLRFQDARGFLEEIESQGEDPELKIDSERLLNFFALKAHAADRQAALTPWCTVERALEGLELLAPGDNLFWNEILERPSLATPQLLVPLLCEPQALEHRWIQTLRRFIEVKPLRPSETSEELKPLAALDVAELKAGDFSLHWARREAPPGALEVLELLPGEFAIDIPEPPPHTQREELRRLYLYARYFEEEAPSHHPYLRVSSAKLTEDFDAEHLRARLVEIFPEAEARELEPPPQARWSSWVRVLEACLSGTGENATPPPPHPRQAADGVPWLTPADLGFAGVSKQILWASRDELEELCDPVSAVRTARETLSPRLRELLKASGYAVPDPAREARLFRGVLEDQWETLALAKSSHLTTPLRQAAPRLRVQAPTLTGPLSPSAIESYLSCGFRYYADRMLKLRESEEWDPSTENALKLGRWTHRALELAFDQGQDATSLEQILKNHIDEFYAMATPSYRRVLEARSQGLARELEAHMLSFENALTEIREGRPLTERRVSGSFGSIPLTGIVDRVDLLREGGLLIWDYKTGSVAEKTLANQLKNGRIQWLLYRHILEAGFEGASPRPCWGGGYLNPLKPSRSALFLVEDGNPLFERLLLIFENAGHPVQVVKRSEVEAAESELAEIVANVLENIAMGVFPAQPRRDQDCLSCTHLALCGRPYVMEIRR